ncbi:hypothetical protein Efla_003231 [Eimeria flavescens]
MDFFGLPCSRKRQLRKGLPASERRCSSSSPKRFPVPLQHFQVYMQLLKAAFEQVGFITHFCSSVFSSPPCPPDPICLLLQVRFPHTRGLQQQLLLPQPLGGVPAAAAAAAPAAATAAAQASTGGSKACCSADAAAAHVAAAAAATAAAAAAAAARATVQRQQQDKQLQQ